MVGLTGFEPVTLRLSSACSNQLSYRPDRMADFGIADGGFGNPQPALTAALALVFSGPCGKHVELRRVELLTYSLQSYRSTN